MGRDYGQNREKILLLFFIILGEGIILVFYESARCSTHSLVFLCVSVLFFNTLFSPPQ